MIEAGAMSTRNYKQVGTVKTFSKPRPGLAEGSADGPVGGAEAATAYSYDLLVALDGVTPALYFSGGTEGLLLHYAIQRTPFGPVLLCEWAGSLVSLSFLEEGSLAGELEELELRWSGAHFVEAPERLEVFREALEWSMGGLVPAYHPQVWSEQPVLSDGSFQGHGDLVPVMEGSVPGQAGEGEPVGQLLLSFKRGTRRWLLARPTRR
jgi:hypothetical protein